MQGKVMREPLKPRNLMPSYTYKSEYTFNLFITPGDLPVMFLIPSTLIHACFPRRPANSVCTLSLLSIRLGVVIL